MSVKAICPKHGTQHIVSVYSCDEYDCAETDDSITLSCGCTLYIDIWGILDNPSDQQNPTCEYCGNNLVLDWRGNCKSCGAKPE